MSIESVPTSTKNSHQQSSERHLRRFMCRFGRSRLAELLSHIQQGMSDSEILQNFALTGAQLESIKQTLVEHSSQRKHG